MTDQRVRSVEEGDRIETNTKGEEKSERKEDMSHRCSLRVEYFGGPDQLLSSRRARFDAALERERIPEPPDKPRIQYHAALKE